MRLTESGKRHNAADEKMVQTIHDHAAKLGADCSMAESRVLASKVASRVTGLDVDGFTDLLEGLADESMLRYSDSYDAKREAITKALRMKFMDPNNTGYSSYNIPGWYGSSPWIRDMYDDAVVCQVDGEMYAVPYTMDDQNVVTLGDAVDVEQAYVIEEDDSEDDDAPMGESFKVKKSTTQGVVLLERDIPAAKRDKIPGGDFAGKGTSFPIQKPEDVGAAVSSMGRAGADNHPPEKIKANIIKIAKRKGASFVSQLPKSWKTKQEAEVPAQPAGTEMLVESAQIPTAGLKLTPLRESAIRDNGIVRIKVIEPGWGSSGYYSADVLKRDCEAAFPAGTQMFWNHQTEAQRTARPEGSLEDLASVTVTPAKWDDNGPKGPGAYAEAKVFSDYAGQIEEKAPYMGVSIRAYGKTRVGKVEGREGKIVESLVFGKSIDYVTTAGAGGEILTESARPPVTREGEQMDEAVLQTLRESIAAKDAELVKQGLTIARINERELLREASAYVTGQLTTVRLPDVTKKRLTESLAANPPAKEDGTLDKVKFATIITESVTVETAYLAEVTGSGNIRGMGATAPPVSEALTGDKLDEVINKNFRGMGMSESAARVAASGRLTS